MTATESYPGCWLAVLDFLRAAEVDTLFGLPSDDLALLAALGSAGPRFVLCRDQRNAAFMATGYALQSGRPGVCVIGKGPATTNVLTGALEAKCSAAPLVVLATGTALERRGAAAFQELDQLAVLSPLVKWADRVDHPTRLVPSLENAWRIATEGVPGPVYLELPEQLLTAEIERTRPWQLGLERAGGYRSPAESAATAAIDASTRPIVLVGGGTRHRNENRVIERFADRIGAAVFATASGRGAVDETHGQFLGLSGLYLRPLAEKLWADADLLISFGSRLEETATFGWPEQAPPVLQVNVAAEEFSPDWPGHRVLGDAGQVAEEWLETLSGHASDEGWRSRISGVRQELFAEAKSVVDEQAGREGVGIAQLLAALDAAVPPDRILVQENGLQDMWSYIYPFYQCAAEGGSIVPSEQTSLGLGAAAAGGVALAAPGRQVVAFVGDGAFNLFRGDLRTFAQERLGVLFVVLCNGGYGWLQSQLDQRGLSNERFNFADGADIAAGFMNDRDVHQATLTDAGQLEPELRRAHQQCVEGKVSVICVPVTLSDAPPGLSEIEGDFPVAN